jgi:hypothetical protein
MTAVPVISATGTPHEIGVTIGAAHAANVRQAVELIARPAGAEAPRAALAELRATLAARLPELLEECDGVAAGAGIDRDDALLLSAGTDVGGRLPGYCSLAGVAAANGPVLAKNLDTQPVLAPLCVLEVITPAGGGLAHVHLTMAGCRWTDGGVNEAGLGLVDASVAAGAPNAEGLPDGLVARELLRRARNVEEALGLLAEVPPRTLGENLLLADRGGRVARASWLPGGLAVEQGAPALATNHPLGAAVEHLAVADDPIGASSRRRLAVLQERLSDGPSEPVETLLDAVALDGEAELWTIGRLLVEVGARRATARLAGAPETATATAERAAASGDVA